MHNFNFPTVKFVSKRPVNSSAGDQNGVLWNVCLYTVKDKKVGFPKSTKGLITSSRLEELVPYLPKKAGETFSFIESGEGFVLMGMSTDQTVQKTQSLLLSAMSHIPANAQRMALHVSEIELYDKELVSGVLMTLRTPWSAKTGHQEPTSHKEVFVVHKDAKIFSTERGVAKATAQALTELLVNMPSNYLTPTSFVENVHQAISHYKIEGVVATVYDKEGIEALGMGSFLAVSKGSTEAPRLIVLEYHGKSQVVQGTASKKKGSTERSPRVALVGKGITFDSGGISLKPANGMGDMKGDMAGAATALCALLYAAMCKLPIDMVSIAVCCENMPSGGALKPGDVITSMSGTTIEVVDTDAEGRLVLADALEFSKSFGAHYTIDMATLTGACIAALGYTHTGLFTKDEVLSSALLDAGLKVSDPAWRLPMEEVHEEMLESSVADIGNLCLGRGAGAQNGAVFLQRFAPASGWAHLDIAGTSAAKGKGATTRPMALMCEFLDRQADIK